MPIREFPFTDLKLTSGLIRDLIAEDPATQQFVTAFFSETELLQQIGRKSFDEKKRKILVDVLQVQNKDIPKSPKTLENIRKLRLENAYTITTGHQLNLFTGPLYSIYKIAQTIALATKMEEQCPEFHFVPIFWMATEDHDFEEINHLQLFGTELKWDIDSGEKAVGRLKTRGLGEFCGQIEAKFSDEVAREKLQKLSDCYRNKATLAEATRALINELFGDYGLLIIDGDDATLKAEFKAVVQSEIEDKTVFRNVTETNKRLEFAGYHTQVHVREINLFGLLENGRRERIVYEKERFKIGDTSFSRDELLKKLDDAPEFFSPNALMRPLYQETLLPNLVYIGGGGELAYWLQLKSSFENFGLTFPLIRLRDSYILLNDKDLDLIKTEEVQLGDLQSNLHEILKRLATQKSEQQLELDDERNSARQLKDQLFEKAVAVDASLGGMVEGEMVKLQKVIDAIEAKMIRAEKKKQELVVNRIEKLYSKVFPGGSFQERVENFIPYYIKDDDFIKSLVKLSIHKTPLIKILNK